MFPGGSSLRNLSNKSKTFQNSKNTQNCSQKDQKVFWKCFVAIFSKTLFCQVFRGGSSLQLLLILMPKNADKISRMVAKKLKLRRPAPHAIILHCGTKSAVIATPNTLTDPYTRFFSNTATISQFIDSDTQIQTIYPHFRKKISLQTLVGSVRYLITLFDYRLFYYSVEPNPTILHCWTMPNVNILLNILLRLVMCTLLFNITKLFPNTSLLLSYAQSLYIFYVYPILICC